MRKLILLLAVLFLSGCAYHSTITFDEDGRSATLKGNVKTEAEIDIVNKKAKLNQIDIPWWQKVLPKNIDVSPK